MKVWLTPKAEAQLDLLAPGGQERIAEAFDLLGDFPHLGKAYSLDSPFSEKEARYFVVHVAHRRAFRITYRLIEERLLVLYVFPAACPLTHPDHLKLVRDE